MEVPIVCPEVLDGLNDGVPQPFLSDAVVFTEQVYGAHAL